jgi:hypothetical protein
MLWRIAVGTIVGSLFVSAMGPVAAAMAQPAATAEERRNDVAALLGAGRRATLDDLAAAAALADAAALDAPDEPWGYLARCDIARRLGNAEVLRACQRDLERVAPRHPETLKVLAGSVASASGGVWLARTVLLGALLGTLGHALARRRRSLRRRRASVGRPVATVFALVTSLVAGGGVALSDETPQSRCEVAARMGDGSTLEQCTGELERLVARAPDSIPYRWALAIAKQDRQAALQLIERAKESRMSVEGVARMERETDTMGRRRAGRFLAWAVGAALLAFAIRRGLRWLAARSKVVVELQEEGLRRR